MSKQVVPVFEQDVVVVSLDRETFSIQIGAPRRQQRTPEETQIWDSMCAQNPRLFDGPILAVERVDWNASSGEACVHALVGRYSSLCLARAQVNTRSSTFEQPACAILSVTGLLTKQRVCSGRQEVLMGLRLKCRELSAALGVCPGWRSWCSK